MNLRSGILPLLTTLLVCSCPSLTLFAQDEDSNAPKNKLLDCEVKVVDHNGNPVKDVKIKPWAIQSASGHGSWNEKSSGFEIPDAVYSDSEGKATVQYPLYDDVEEQIKSIGVSISVSHPDHPRKNDIHIPVPRRKPFRPYRVKLQAGAPIEATVLLDGEPVADDSIRAIWSGGSWTSEDTPWEVNESEKFFRIPPVAAGPTQTLFVRVEDDSITHFSSLEKYDVDGELKSVKKEIPLIPAIKLHGKLDDSVPRPVENGRIKLMTVTDGKSWDDIKWLDWAEVNEDGTFTVEAWPKGEAVQVVAMCDGFIGKSGKAPDIVPKERAGGSHLRPQCFPDPDAELVIEMEPLSTCRIEVSNAFGKSLAGVTAAANPNVGWWNGGSQIYCYPLNSMREYMTTGKVDFKRDGEGVHKPPFRAESNEDGIILIQLPAGRTSLWIFNDRYQMAARLGRRSRKIEVDFNKPMAFDFVLQPKGLDVLGDWEDLCGLVFG